MFPKNRSEHDHFNIEWEGAGGGTHTGPSSVKFRRGLMAFTKTFTNDGGQGEGTQTGPSDVKFRRGLRALKKTFTNDGGQG